MAMSSRSISGVGRLLLLMTSTAVEMQHFFLPRVVAYLRSYIPHPNAADTVYYQYSKLEALPGE